MKPFKATAANVNRVLRENNLEANSTRGGLQARGRRDFATVQHDFGTTRVVSLSYARPLGAAHRDDTAIADLFERATAALAERGLVVIDRTGRGANVIDVLPVDEAVSRHPTGGAS